MLALGERPTARCRLVACHAHHKMDEFWMQDQSTIRTLRGRFAQHASRISISRTITLPPRDGLSRTGGSSCDVISLSLSSPAPRQSSGLRRGRGQWKIRLLAAFVFCYSISFFSIALVMFIKQEILTKRFTFVVGTEWNMGNEILFLPVLKDFVL